MLSENSEAGVICIEGNEAASREAGSHTNVKSEFKPWLLKITIIEADGMLVNNTPIHSPDKEAHCALVFAEMQAVNRLKIAISQTDFWENSASP